MASPIPGESSDRRPTGPIRTPAEGARSLTVLGGDDVAPSERFERTEARYRRLVEASPDGIFLDRAGVVVFANTAFLRLMGAREARDLVGRRTLELVHPDSQPSVREMQRRMLEIGRAEPATEERLVRLDGTAVDVEVAAAPFDDDDGRSIEVVVRDATEHRRRDAEIRRARDELARRVDARTAELLASERALRAVLEAALDAVISTDRAGLVLGWSARAVEMFGWTAAEAIGRPLLDLVAPPHLRDVARAHLERHAHGEGGGLRARFETPVVARDGREFPVEVSLARLDGTTGPAFSAFVRDVRERRSAEEAIRDGERRLRRIIDLVPHFIFAKDERGRFLLANRAVADVYGTTVEALIGKTDADFVRSPEEVERFRRNDLAVLSGSTARLVTEERITDPAGVEHIVETIKIPFAFSSAAPRAALGVATDVTERVETERRIRDDERRLRQIIDLVPHFVFAKDLDGRFLLVNQAVAEAYGTTVENLLGRRDADFAKSAEEVAHFRADDLEVMRGGRPKVIPEERITDARGTQRILQTVKIPFTFSGTGAPAVLGVSTDITERKHAEERLLQAQKMEGLGRLAGGIAHDFNNLLTAILGYAQLAVSDPGTSPTTRSDVDAIRGAAERASALTRQLLTFARRQRTESRVVDLNELTLDLDKLLRRVIGANVELVTVVPDGSTPVEADPGQIEQVLVNLAVNARDAMPKGGRIVLSLRDVPAEERPPEAAGQVADGPCIEVSVEDTGAGMAPDVLPRVFEPFFTTKGPGLGTGLGLATSYGIVKQYGGHIWCESELGRGSTFHILLPRSSRAPTRQRPEADGPTGGGGETVLVVDDDGIVRDVAVRALRAAGYDVLSASTAADALVLAAGHPGPIHLLVADVVMPGMSGPEVAARLHATRPGTRVLFVSGYHETPVEGTEASAALGEVLAKPFTPAVLARTVRETLDRPPAPQGEGGTSKGREGGPTR